MLDAARRVSQQFQNDHPECPWEQMIGMRHKIAHDYMQVNFDIVWDAATMDLPLLLEKLNRIFPHEKK